MNENSESVIFFDIDDTLLDTSSFAETARKAAVEQIVNNGFPLSEIETYAALKAIIAEKGSNYDKHFNLLTKRVLGKENPMLVTIGMITYHNVKFATLRTFPHTIDILIYLKSQGYKLAVISNGIAIKQWEKLIRLNLHHFFDEVITSEEVGIEKPETGIFEEALIRMKGDPMKCVMVGNKFSTDALGAINAGMSAILVNSDVTHEDEKYIMEHNLDIKVIDTIEEINTLL